MVLLITVSLLLTVVAGELFDSFAKPRGPFVLRGRVAFFWRAAATASIWLLAFGLTGRPLFAAVATAVTVVILVTISNIKLRFLGEPLLFADFGLLPHIPKHPQLFYIQRRWAGAVALGLLALCAVIAAWMTIEPRGVSWPAQLLALALAAIVPLYVWLWPSAGASAARLVRDARPLQDLERIGLLASLLAYTAAWRCEPPLAPCEAVPVRLLQPPSFDAIIVVQAESFIDLRRHGCSDVRLPAFDRLKRRAISAGLLEVACEGAYTLRPESSVITGLGTEDQGFDRFYPYLRPHRLSAAALPRLLAEAGWDTLFVHPHDGDFFRRGHAMPVLGFARFADESAFAGARRVGPYVCDEAVGQLLSTELSARDGARPLFAYAVTMEAHDPYGPGRLADEPDPIRQYIRHIENADRMLAALADALDAGERRALLVFFGDHVPFLPSFADPFSDTRTDYLVVEFGPRAGRTTPVKDISRPEDLHTLILEKLAEAAPAAARSILADETSGVSR